MSSINLTIRCFGVARTIGETVTLTLPKDAVVADARAALIRQLEQDSNNSTLISQIHRSRFATDEEILFETSPLNQAMSIAIIPPVSGG